ncbi:MAG TPA: thiamine phosphate synthase [Gemmatimonadales bacterium]|nr:thiamine phosphate synthase [Gemmatimonadales bacterium]
MRPLPRLHAVTDAAVIAATDFPVRAAAIAAAGSAVALHARDRSAGGAVLARVAARLVALARPPEASVFVNARPDVAQATGAQGVQLGTADLRPADARVVFPRGWIGRSVHSAREAEQAAAEGANFLMVGAVYSTASHPSRPAVGLALVRDSARLGLPVIAIGGIDADRAAEVRDQGAWGVAAITALWGAADPAAAALALLAPWTEET